MDYGNLYKRKDLVHFIYNLQCVSQEFNWQSCKKNLTSEQTPPLTSFKNSSHNHEKQNFT